MFLNREGLSLRSFWALPETPPERDEDVDLHIGAENLEGPLRDAVAHRLISDVPLGCFLSGGMDSSLVAAHAQELVSGRVRKRVVWSSDVFESRRFVAALNLGASGNSA